MLSLAKPKGTFPTIIDSTMLADARACETQFYWAFSRNLRIRGTSIHLHAGAAFAAGLESARRAYYEQNLTVDGAVALGLRRLWAEYGDVTPPPGYENKSGYAMGRALVAYFDRFPLDSDNIVPADLTGKKGIEFSFGVPLEINHPDTNEPLVLAGRCDMLGVFQGGMFVVDEKTSSQLGPSWSRKWDLRAQLMCYTWAAKQYGLPVVGAIVRGVGLYKERCDFAEAIMYFPDWQLARWYDTTMLTIERMIESYKQNRWSYNFSDACISYGGCPYSRLCLKREPENWLDDYEVNNWNPLQRGGGAS